jgi:hypothetical protein
MIRRATPSNLEGFRSYWVGSQGPFCPSSFQQPRLPQFPAVPFYVLFSRGRSGSAEAGIPEKGCQVRITPSQQEAAPSATTRTLAHSPSPLFSSSDHICRRQRACPAHFYNLALALVESVAPRPSLSLLLYLFTVLGSLILISKGQLPGNGQYVCFLKSWESVYQTQLD